MSVHDAVYQELLDQLGSDNVFGPVEKKKKVYYFEMFCGLFFKFCNKMVKIWAIQILH